MKVKPLFDKVVVESLEKEEKTKSGFILPSASQ
ncbi:MAG: co-chaperone GroES, partial [Clostridia bacterium]|nr:co-chaperone GroES [Clostridia bacterium]